VWTGIIALNAGGGRRGTCLPAVTVHYEVCQLTGVSCFSLWLGSSFSGGLMAVQGYHVIISRNGAGLQWACLGAPVEGVWGPSLVTASSCHVFPVSGWQRSTE
jgi:hypothetical protein